MEAIPLTRASQLVQVTDTLERLGISAERILEQSNLPMWHYCDPDDLIPTHHIHVLMDRAARSLENPTFGLLVSTNNSLATLGSYGKLVASSATVHSAFATSCLLLHLHTSSARCWLTEAMDEVWFCCSQSSGPKTGRREMEQYYLMWLIEHVRMGAGASWCPTKVCLKTPEAPQGRLRAVFGDPEIRICEKITCIAVPRALLALPLWQHTMLPGATREAVERRLRRTAPASSFVDTLRQLAGTLLKEEGAPRIERMAEIAGLSVRSLQRRLGERGLSHFRIVDEARYQIATHLLGHSEIRITDIAMDLGYADSAHFTRAFKRWAGVTPKTYRSANPA